MQVTLHSTPADAGLRSDRAVLDAYEIAVGEQWAQHEGLPCADDLDPWNLPDEATIRPADGVSAAPSAPALPDQFARVEQADATCRSARAAAAAQDLLFHEVLTAAAADPAPWVGPGPTVDPLWRDARGWSHATVRARRVSLAVRSAAADVGARTQLIAADLAGSLPDDAPEAWAAFDDDAVGPAATAVSAKFRARARAIRERVHRQSLTERHARAARDRRVEVMPVFDGMSVVTAILPAEKAQQIDRQLDAHARHLRDRPTTATTTTASDGPTAAQLRSRTANPSTVDITR